MEPKYFDVYLKWVYGRQWGQGQSDLAALEYWADYAPKPAEGSKGKGSTADRNDRMGTVIVPRLGRLYTHAVWFADKALQATIMSTLRDMERASLPDNRELLAWWKRCPGVQMETWLVLRC
jgi:hypothetical protein